MLCLLFLPIVPGAMLIQGGTLILDSRVFESASVAFRFFMLFHVRPFGMFIEQSYIHRAILL